MNNPSSAKIQTPRGRDRTTDTAKAATDVSGHEESGDEQGRLLATVKVMLSHGRGPREGRKVFSVCLSGRIAFRAVSRARGKEPSQLSSSPLHWPLKSIFSQPLSAGGGPHRRSCGDERRHEPCRKGDGETNGRRRRRRGGRLSGREGARVEHRRREDCGLQLQREGECDADERVRERGVAEETNIRANLGMREVG